MSLILEGRAGHKAQSATMDSTGSDQMNVSGLSHESVSMGTHSHGPCRRGSTFSAIKQRLALDAFFDLVAVAASVRLDAPVRPALGQEEPTGEKESPVLLSEMETMKEKYALAPAAGRAMVAVAVGAGTQIEAELPVVSTVFAWQVVE